MSDRDEPAFDDSAFDDPEFDDVRALLAEARVTDPVPADVAARLDETLAALQRERTASGDRAGSNVVPLRRRVGPLLTAAAAVVVIAAGGVGIAQVARNAPDGADNATSAEAETQDDADAGSVSPSAPGADGAQPETLRDLTEQGVPELTTAAFATDAARLMRAVEQSARADSTSGKASEGPTASPAPATSPDEGYVAQAPPVTATPDRLRSLDASLGACAGPSVTDSVSVPVTLDGALAALVFRPPTATDQRVEAWSCDGRTLLASATVPR